jgi:CRP-like cAMP-binding protein
MQIPSLSPQEQQLERDLLAKGWLSALEMQGFLEKRDTAWRSAYASLKGNAAEISEESGCLCLRSFPDAQLLATVPLEKEAKPPSPHVWGRDVLYLNPEDGRLLEYRSLPSAYQPHLLMPEAGLAYLGGFQARDRYLGYTRQSLDLRISRETSFRPCDLTVSPSNNLILVCNRRAGTLQVISLLTQHQLALIQIRPPGSLKAINLTIDAAEENVYLTDQSTAQLHILDLRSFRLISLQTGLGVLGNLVSAPDSRYLYLLSVKPELRLHYFDVESFQAVQELSLKGQAFSQISDCPTDLMHLTPDQSLLILVTSLNEPQPLTPIVHVIRTQTIKTIRRYAIKDGCHPALLVSGLPNPLQLVAAKKLPDWLSEKISLAQLRTLNTPQEEAFAAPVSTTQSSPLPPFPALNPPENDSEVDELLARSAPPISLPIEAETALVELLVQVFYQETQFHLRAHPAEIRRLRQVAHELRLELEQKYAVMAEVENILDQYNFQTLITRDALLITTYPLMKGKELPFAPAESCPLCQAFWSEPVLCRACGFQLAEIQERPELEASLEAFDHLLEGQILLALPERSELMLLNNWHRPLWTLPGLKGHFQAPVYAIALASDRYLITDQRAGKVLEITPKGDICWESHLPLNNPRMATLCKQKGEELILIVDADRVIAINRQQQLRHVWGDETGVPLKDPRDVQFTSKGTWLITDSNGVIEITADKHVLNKWGRFQGIKNPVSARRIDKGQVLIVDAALSKIFIFKDNKQLQALSYWPPPKASALMAKAPPPQRVAYLPNGEMILIGTKFWLQFQIDLEKPRWVSLLPQEKKQLTAVSQVSVPEREQPLPSPYKALLKQVSFLKEADPALLDTLAEKLRPLTFAAGEWVLREGESGSSLFFVAEGEVEVLKEDTQNVLARMGPGDLFGEMALILSEPRSASVRTYSACQLLQLERTDFNAVVAKFPLLARALRMVAHKRKVLAHQLKTSRNQDLLNRMKSKMAMGKLREMPFFEGGEEAFYDTLATCLRPVSFLPDQMVFQAGEIGHSLYFISRGAVGVFADQADTPSVELSVGDVFGEMALVTDQPRNATVRSLGYCQFFELERDSFEHVCRQFPHFSQRMQTLVRQRQEMNLLKETGQRIMPVNLSEWVSAAHATLFYTSPLQERLLALNQRGEVIEAWGPEKGLHLFQPFRVSHCVDSLLLADTGNDRILELDSRTHQVVREWGDHRLSLQQPRSAVKNADGFYLICDEGNQRLVATTATGQIVWEYTTPHEILSPYFAEFTQAEGILFCDTALHVVREINRNGEVLWSYGSLLIAGSGPDELCEPMCAKRLPDGTTLIADTGNERLLWVNPQGGLVHSWHSPAQGRFRRPVHFELQPDGEILVCSGQSDMLVMLSAQGKLLWEKQLVMP